MFEQPSHWIQRWAHLAPNACQALDVACGRGRHARWLHEQGFCVHAVDQQADLIENLADWLEQHGDSTARNGRVLCHDLERGEQSEQEPWPFADQHFGLVVVTNYLWRPLLSTIAESLVPGGVLLYETFTQDQASIGKPSHPNFLLRSAELLHVASQNDLRVIAYEDGFDATQGQGRFVQRLAAVKPLQNLNDSDKNVEPVRYKLI